MICFGSRTGFMDTLYRVKLLYIKELYKNLFAVSCRAQCPCTGNTDLLSCVGRLWLVYVRFVWDT